MIFYFSGTGNSRWAALQIASLIRDKALDISQIKEMPNLQNEQQIGLVFPIYAWGAPEVILEFLKKCRKTNTSVFTFGVCTCGEEAGLAMKKLSKSYPLDSCYSLVMPNNYIIGSSLDPEPVIQQKIVDAHKEIRKLSSEISQKEKVYRVKEGSFAGLKSSIIHFGFNKFARTTKAFYALDSCNGCGLCAKNCPAHVISLVNQKPVWKGQCYQCLRCINECPKRAIQYGKSTENKGRYTIEAYLGNLEC